VIIVNREQLEGELKRAHVNLNGWLPTLQCDICKTRWEPFAAAVGDNAPTLRFDYWMCPKRCNANAQISIEAKTALPRYVVINDVPGMIFSDEDLIDFERYVRSMEATEIYNRPL
jgi:hypothetical protein